MTTLLANKPQSVPLTKSITTMEEICLSNEHTIYIHEFFEKETDITTLVKRHNALVKKARQAKFKVSLKYKTKQELLALLPIYLETYPQYKNNYCKLLFLAEQIVEEGLFVPTTNNKTLNKLYAIRNQITPLFYHSGVLGSVHDLKRTIENAEKTVDNAIKEQLNGKHVELKIFL